jgi:hypothetical protein
MESYFLRVKTFSRGKGSSATKAAAYRAGERIRDERSGAVFDYSDRDDVAHSEIILPATHDVSAEMAWAHNRSLLWNAVQNSGRNWNSRLAREVLVLLPIQLNPTQRIALTSGFAHELADRYGSAVDLAIHRPRAGADQRHHHAHLLMTTRQVGPAGLGSRTTLDLSGTERHERGLGPSKDDLLWIRERWAQLTNEALKDAGLADRIDHRSYKARGIDREPKPLVPQSIFYAERLSGKTTPAGDDIRARHRERVEARSKGREELERVLQRQRALGHKHAIQWSEGKGSDKGMPRSALTKEQLNEKRREYCRANSAEINRKQRERRTANSAEVNRKQQERRLANLDAVRRKDRERYHIRRAAEATVDASKRVQDKRARELKAATLAVPGRKSASLGRSSPASAEESVKSWLASRRDQKQPAADESLNRWLAYREKQIQTGPKGGPTRVQARERPLSQEQGKDGKKSKPIRKDDLSL